MQDRYRCIARVAKAHGRRGEVVTVPVHGLPPLVFEGLEGALVPPRLKGSRWHQVESCSSDGRSGSLVALSGVDSMGDAEGLVGSYVLARVSDLPGDLPLHDRERLVGRQVVDAFSGVVSTIHEVMCGPANDVWVLRCEMGEMLIPVVDEVVSEVPEDGPITVRVPAGLDWEGVGDAL